MVFPELPFPELPLPADNVNIINIVFGSVMTAWIGVMQFFHGATIKDEDR